MKRCESCGTKYPNAECGEYDLFDYCAVCSRDLCDRCLAKGCCGHVPGKSGLGEDYPDDDDLGASQP